MTRKCSHCNKIGHNSRTCEGVRTGSVPSATMTTTAAASTTTAFGSVRLFGVRIGGSHSSLSTISKCVSLDCISSASAVSSSPSASSPHSSFRFAVEENPAFVDEFVSYGVLPGSQDLIKKGVPWSEDEHKQFLLGLEKLGKGDWRGISKHFVHTRTPTQVASHAQKYFLRLASLDNKKQRSSLFDMVRAGNNKDQSLKRRNPIPTEQQLRGRRRPSSPNQQLVDAPHPFDLSLGSLSNNADHSSASSSSSLCVKHTSVDLDLTIGPPRTSPLSSFGAMRVS